MFYNDFVHKLHWNPFNMSIIIYNIMKRNEITPLISQVEMLYCKYVFGRKKT